MCVPRCCWQYSMNWTAITHPHTSALRVHCTLAYIECPSAYVKLRCFCNGCLPALEVTISCVNSIVYQPILMIILMFTLMNPELAHLIPQQHSPKVTTSRWYHPQWCSTWFLNAEPGTTHWAFNTLPLSTGHNPNEARGNMSLCHTENAPFIKYGLRC